MIKGLILQGLVTYVMYSYGISLNNVGANIAIGIICLIIGDGLTKEDRWG